MFTVAGNWEAGTRCWRLFWCYAKCEQQRYLVL